MCHRRHRRPEDAVIFPVVERMRGDVGGSVDCVDRRGGPASLRAGPAAWTLAEVKGLGRPEVEELLGHPSGVRATSAQGEAGRGDA
jgi:hypothetical protein